MDLFDLSAKITLDSKDYENGLKNAASSAEGFGSKLGSAMKVGLAAVAAVTAAVTALTGAIVAAVGKTAEYGDTVDKQSQKLGMSAQAYQEWDAILQHSGASIDSMSRGMVTLSKQAESNSDAFAKLGITQEELASLNQEELFARTIEGLQGMEAGTERTALAQQLLGGSAKELGALLNTSAEDTEAMRQRVHELGGVMSDEAVKASAAYQDSLQDMKTAFSGLSRNMTAEFLPSITTVMDGLTEIFSGGDGLSKISEGIQQFTSKLQDVLPRVMEVGGNIINLLASAIIENLPMLFDSATDLIMTIGNGLIKNLPMLVKSALQIILSIAKGISKSLPQLIPTIVDVILEIVDTLIDNVDLLVEASIEIMIALSEGMINALPVLLSKAPQIIATFVGAIIKEAVQMGKAALQLIVSFGKGLANYASQLISKGAELVSKVGQGVKSALSGALNWGKELINNFVKGIQQAWQGLKDKVGGVASAIAGKFKHSIPREGPFKRDDLWGAHMIENFTNGLLDKAPDLIRAATQTADSVASAMQVGDMSVGGSYSAFGGNGYSGMQPNGVSIYGDVSINIDGAGKNADEIGRELYKKLIRQGVAAYAY